MPYQTQTDLASLISARICHDIIAPIGAIRNGLELLELTDFPDSPELSLVSESAQAACTQIEFYRIAFGRSDQTLFDGNAIGNIATAFYQNQRRQLDWQLSTPLSRAQLKPILLGLLCLDSMMPHGGKVHIAAKDDARYILAGDGPKINVDTELWRANDKESLAQLSLSAAQVHFAVFHLELARQNLCCDLKQDAQHITLSIAPRESP